MNRAMLAAAAAPLLLGGTASADVTISNHATAHMSCVANICTATGANAYLNVGDLQTMLASADVTVKSNGAAPDIRVVGALGWSSTNKLTLDSYRSVDVAKPVSVLAAGGLSIVTNDGGTGGVFTTAKAGNVHFWSLSSSLTIDGASYTLIGDLASLAGAVAADQFGNFALAADYDAGPDGVYSFTAIPTPFRGRFEGLGNTISRFRARGQGAGGTVGLFDRLESDARAENLVIRNEHLTATGRFGNGGGFAVVSVGLIRNVHTSGSGVIGGFHGNYGGLVAVNDGTIVASSSTASIPSGGRSISAALVSFNDGTILQSWSAGEISSRAAGGLVTQNDGSIVDCYSLASADANEDDVSNAGGLIALNSSGASVASSYAAGAVSGIVNFGGVVGVNHGTLSGVYWDTDDTGQDAAHGCGSGDCSGATGLTRAALQAALPAGFDPNVWAQAPGINNGLPYLIDNPPR